MSDKCDPCDLVGLRRRLAGAIGPEAAESVRIREIVIDDNALARLPDAIGRLAPADGNVVIVWDDRSMLRGRESLKQVVHQAVQAAGLPIRLVELPRELHADDESASTVLLAIDDGSVVVAVGSGNLVDTCKHACWLRAKKTGRKTPLVSWPTANSVNAYSSSLAILLVSGVKRSTPSVPPDAILCDLPTLASAPPAMQRAGLGDMMARCVASGDWYLAHVLGMDESYTEGAYHILGQTEELLLANAADIGRQTAEGTRLLAEALLLAGIVLSAAKQTAPLSGWEHVISHYLDLVALAKGRPLALHGAQVGVGSIIAAEAYALLVAEGRPDDRPLDEVFPPPDEVKRQIDEHFRPIDPRGAGRQELWTDCKAKLARWNGQRDRWAAFRGEWRAGRIQAELARLVRRPEVVRQALAAAGAPTRFDQLEPPVDGALAADTIRNAHLVRQRFTLGDLLASLGLLDRVVEVCNAS